MTGVLLAALLALGQAGAAKATPYVQDASEAYVQAGEVIAEIRVHGNHVTADADVIALAVVKLGDAVTPETVSRMVAKLKSSGKFDDVQVLKRFASISDMTRVSLVIIVNEGPVRIEFNEGPGGDDVAVVKRRGGFGNVMFLPLLDGEDGYGLTYGFTAALANVVGERSRLSAPLTWGGTKRAGLELEKNFASGPLTRMEIGGSIQRRTNPAFEEDDDRQRAWVRAERSISVVRLGATAAWENVKFGPLDDDLRSVGADITLDTRLDPTYPRNAVLLTAAWDRVAFKGGESLHRTNFDGRGYLGLIGQTVLAVRGVRQGANGPQPAYFKPLLGGWSNLRGFEAGDFIGDILLAGSAELFVPLTTPMSVGRMGISAFVDTGVAYDYGQPLKEQVRRTGIGGSVWMTATVFRLSLSVAHGRGKGTRVNFGGGLTF